MAHVLLLLAPWMIPLAASAQPIVIDPSPKNIEDVSKVLGETLPKALEAAQCGGWVDAEIDAAGNAIPATVEGRIATVKGLPGRSGQWNGDIPSGMAKRNDAYEYPDSTVGYTTACAAKTDTIAKRVWRAEPNGCIRQVAVTFEHPYFEDPPCLWRRENGPPPLPLQDDAPPVPYRDLALPYTKQHCEEFSAMLNGYQYEDCLEVQPNATCASGQSCARWGTKFLCSDAEVQPNSPWSNARICNGQDCRCPLPVAAGACALSAPNGSEYRSFYRSYLSSYERALPTPHEAQAPGAKEVLSRDALVACYGFYEEFDPKTRTVTDGDRRCAIVMETRDLMEQQRMRGKIFPDVLPPDPQRKRAAQNDIWARELGAGFTLLREDRLEGEAGASLLRQDVDAAQMTTIPESGEKANVVRAFDDTGPARAFITWWQQQQTLMSSILRGSLMRLVLPPESLFGPDLSDPFFAGTPSLPERSVTRTEPMEVQLRAGEEHLIGELLAHVERLWQMEEEPIPIVVPLGSPVEFRAIAQAWCTQFIKETGEPTCANAPQHIRALMERLEEYAARIEDVRMFRSLLAQYAGAHVVRQAAFQKPMAEWVEKSMENYRLYLQERSLLAQNISPLWREVQEGMNRFHDTVNMPWCMNHRFTTPIYSLLDPWMRREGGKISAENLPSLLGILPARQDAILDLSSLAHLRGALHLPVLKPVQIRLNLSSFTPPQTITVIPPSLPPIEPVHEAFLSTLKHPLPVSPPPAPPAPLSFPLMGEENILKISEKASAMRDLFAIRPNLPAHPNVETFAETYDRFWKSLAGADPQGNLEVRTRACVPAGNQGDVTACCEANALPCVHPEMSLRESLERIASRPLVFLPEDFLSTGVPRAQAEICPPEDFSCALLPPESTLPGIRWEATMPSRQQENAASLRTLIRRLSLPAPFGHREELPPLEATMEELLPLFDLPPALPLTPSP